MEGQGEGEERGRPVTGGGRLAAYRKQDTRPDVAYRHARIYPGRPIRGHQCRNPGRAGKCHPGRREAAGPFKDWMLSFHFSVLKFSPAPPNYLNIYLGPAFLSGSRLDPPTASPPPLTPFLPSSARLKRAFLGSAPGTSLCCPRSLPLLFPARRLCSTGTEAILTAPPTPQNVVPLLPSAAG